MGSDVNTARGFLKCDRLSDSLSSEDEPSIWTVTRTVGQSYMVRSRNGLYAFGGESTASCQLSQFAVWTSTTENIFSSFTLWFLLNRLCLQFIVIQAAGPSRSSHINDKKRLRIFHRTFGNHLFNGIEYASNLLAEFIDLRSVHHREMVSGNRLKSEPTPVN